MLPLEKVKNLIGRHSKIEKELASQEINKDEFAKLSKEYSELNEIIKPATNYLNYQKNTLN